MTEQTIVATAPAYLQFSGFAGDANF